MAAQSGIRAGRAFVELFADDSRLVRGLKRASARLRSWGRSITSMGARIAAAAAAVLGPMLGATKIFASAGDQLDKMSKRTGIGVESLSQLQYAAELSGSSLEDVGNAVQRMNRRLGRITVGQASKTQAKAMETLGLSAQRLENLAPEDRLLALADAMAAMEDPAEAAGLAQRAFGTQVDALLPLLLQGSDAIRGMMNDADRLGLTWTKMDTDSAAAVTDAWAKLSHVLKRVVTRVGGALAPALTVAADKLAEVIAPTMEWIQANSELIVSVFKVAAIAAGIGGALIALGGVVVGVGAVFSGLASIVTGIGAALGVVGSAIAALLSPIGLTIAAIGGLTAAVLYFSGAGSQVLGALGEKFNDLKTTALAAWKGIGDALAAGDIALAGKVLWTTLKVEWQKGVAAVNRLWEDAKWYFFAVWNEMTTTIAKGFITATATIKSAWVNTVSFMQGVWSSFSTKIANAWNSLQERAGNLLLTAMNKVGVLSDETAKVAKETLAKDLGDKRDRRTNDNERRQQEIADKRESDLAAIEQQEKDANAVLESDKQRYYDNLDRQRNRDLDAAQQAVDDAKREWEDALTQASRVAGLESDAKKGVMDMPDLGEVEQKLTARGTFSAAAAARMSGAGSVEQQQLEVERNMALTLDDIAKFLRHAGLPA